MSGEELKLLDTARRNIRTFINGATFKCRADQDAALACVDVLESHIQDQNNLITVLRDVVAIDAHPLPERPQEGVQEKIVAWLRNEAEMRDRLADEHPTVDGIRYNKARAIALHMAVEAIERGEHMIPPPTETKESGE